MEKYIITYYRFNIIIMDYSKEEVVVITDNKEDVYKKMGEIIANSLEEIRHMRYYKTSI